MNYIRHALELLGEAEVLNSLDIEFVGIEDDGGKTRYGGHNWLTNFRNTYESNPTLYHRPILLLYDCDTEKQSEQIEKLWVRSIEKNTENTKVTRGIENLFPIELFKDEFYLSKVEMSDYGEKKTLEEFKKKEFCQWICEERRNPDDFEKFKEVVKIIKEFLEATQQHPPQETKPE